jgi:hypothetical protein
MKRIIFITTLFIILLIPQVWASTTQYPNPYRQTMWNDFTDKLNTIGQTTTQARMTKIRLHQIRTETRINDINRARRAAWLSHQKTN